MTPASERGGTENKQTKRSLRFAPLWSSLVPAWGGSCGLHLWTGLGFGSSAGNGKWVMFLCVRQQALQARTLLLLGCVCRLYLPLVLVCFWCTGTDDWYHNQSLAIGWKGLAQGSELLVLQPCACACPLTTEEEASKRPCQGCLSMSPCPKVRSTLPMSFLD